jgi:RNA polymerase sigma factor (sigma-70 family)
MPGGLTSTTLSSAYSTAKPVLRLSRLGLFRYACHPRSLNGYVTDHLEKLRDFATFEVFLKHLSGMACHRVKEAQRKHFAQKRDLVRHRHLSNPGVAAAATTVADPQPDPAKQAASHEEWLRWLESLPQLHQQVALKLRDGLSYQEIAEELGCSKRSIQGSVARIRGKVRLY